MSDVIAFLKARLDEEEEEARAANTDEARRPWGDPDLTPVPQEEWGAMICGYLGGPVGDYCAAWSPLRVLADIAAKREIIDAIGSANDLDVRSWESDFEQGLQSLGRHVLRRLVQPYSSHPGYDPEWTP